MNKKIPLEDLDLSVRSFNALKRAGFNYAEELTACTAEELTSVKNLKSNTTDEIQEKLSAIGLCLAEKSTGVLESLNQIKPDTSEPANYNFPAVAAECAEIILRTDRLRVQFFDIADKYNLPLAALLSKLTVVVRKNHFYTAPKTQEACDDLLNAICLDASDIRIQLDRMNEEHPSLNDVDIFSHCDMLY